MLPLAPWQDKKVRRKYQSPWITGQVLGQLRIRDSLLKTARRLNTGKSWDDYRAARNKAVTLVRRAKRDFDQSAFKVNKRLQLAYTHAQEVTSCIK